MNISIFQQTKWKTQVGLVVFLLVQVTIKHIAACLCPTSVFFFFRFFEVITFAKRPESATEFSEAFLKWFEGISYSLAAWFTTSQAVA